MSHHEVKTAMNVANSNKPYLSIVIPLYNEEALIEKLLSKIVEIGKGFYFSYEMIK